MVGESKKKRLTVMIIPHDTHTAETRQFNISTSFIRFIWIFLVVLVSLSIIGLANSANRIVNWTKLEDTSRQNEVLSKENEILKGKVEVFASKSENLASRLNKIEDLIVNLKILAGLSKGSKERLGKGKGGPEKSDLHLASISLDFLESTEGIDDTLTQIEEAALEHELDLKEIKGILGERKAKLAATPFILPVQGRFTSGFGYRRSPFTGGREFHEGIDIASRVGTPIRATADGKVTYTGWKSGYGQAVEISHGYGYKTVYGHNSWIRVKSGQRVKRGDIIASLGSTGSSTGPHLHYEIRVNNKAINPWRCILY